MSTKTDAGKDRRGYELSVLNDVARTLNASVDLPSMLERALERVAELLGLATGWVLLLDEATGEPYLAAAQNLPLGLAREPKRMTGTCYCLDSFCTGELPGAVNVGVVRCSRLRGLTLGDAAGLQFHASVPLKVYDGEDPEGGLKRLGMLNVASPEWRELGDEELELLRTIGDVLGVAVERARLHARRLEAAQTEERNRLAREIHDTIAQDFSAITFQLEAAAALLAQHAGPERVLASVTAALDLARKGLEETRRSVLDLRAAPLEGRTLPQALAALAEEAARQGDARVTFTPAPSAESVPPAVEVGLYRIAQEALRNALTHAAARRVTLRLDAAPGLVRLIIEDDGRGFDVDGAQESGDRRFGLVGMRERLRLLRGSLRVESAPGAGTRITAEVPVPHA